MRKFHRFGHCYQLPILLLIDIQLVLWGSIFLNDVMKLSFDRAVIFRSQKGALGISKHVFDCQDLIYGLKHPLLFTALKSNLRYAIPAERLILSDGSDDNLYRNEDILELVDLDDVGDNLPAHQDVERAGLPVAEKDNCLNA